MRISNFFYSILQALRNMWRNKGYTIASIATTSACLFLFGVLFALMLNLNSMFDTAQESVSVTVFFESGTTEETILQLKIAVEERDEVASVTYISADEAWASFSEEYLGDYADGFTENPLEDSANLEIFLADVSQQEELVEYLQGLDAVREVNYSELTATALSGASNLLMYASVAIIVLLLVVSIFLISNTIAMGITRHWEEIVIMKYIGATDFFVRAPYVIEGVIIGVLGTLLPLGLLHYFYIQIIEMINTQFSVLTVLLTFLPVEDVFYYLVPISVVLGVGIGFFGSVLTVRRRLNV